MEDIVIGSGATLLITGVILFFMIKKGKLSWGSAIVAAFFGISLAVVVPAFKDLTGDAAGAGTDLLHGGSSVIDKLHK